MESCRKNMFVSIIVPVHNSQRYISQCIDSLLDQDISDEEYEIICVDDGSTDDSGVIIDEYAEKHSNIVAHHKINGGVSSARNIGLSLAQSKYVWFIDADDFIFPSVLKKLKNLAETNDSDRIKVESYSFDNDFDSEQVKSLYKEGSLSSNMPYKEVMATRTLYKREYLIRNKILFLEGVHYGEDGIFNYQTLIHNPKTDDSGVLAYFYRRHDAAATSKPKKERVRKSLDGTKKVFDVLVCDYNNGICLNQTRRMLLYWMYGVLENYSILDCDYFCKNFNWEYNLTNIPLNDFELRRLYRLFRYLSKSHDYRKLTKFIKKRTRRNKRAEDWQTKKKIILGYIKHPKRLLNKLKILIVHS